jgi:hypothetical protein
LPRDSVSIFKDTPLVSELRQDEYATQVPKEFVENERDGSWQKPELSGIPKIQEMESQSDRTRREGKRMNEGTTSRQIRKVSGELC